MLCRDKFNSPPNGGVAALGGRVDAATGAQYAAWVYPEGSQGDNYPNPPTGVAVIETA